MLAPFLLRIHLSKMNALFNCLILQHSTRHQQKLSVKARRKIRYNSVKANRWKEAVRFQHKHPNQTLQENYKERRAGQSGHYESSTPVLDYAPTYLYSLPRAEALTDILFQQSLCGIVSRQDQSNLKDLYKYPQQLVAPLPKLTMKASALSEVTWPLCSPCS